MPTVAGRYSFLIVEEVILKKRPRVVEHLVIPERGVLVPSVAADHSL